MTMSAALKQKFPRNSFRLRLTLPEALIERWFEMVYNYSINSIFGLSPKQIYPTYVDYPSFVQLDEITRIRALFRTLLAEENEECLSFFHRSLEITRC